MSEYLRHIGADRFSDPELFRLLDLGVSILGIKGIERVVQALQSFDGPVHTSNEDGYIVVDNHYRLKKALACIPEYIDVAETAGLSLDQATNLIVHLIKSDPYDISPIEQHIIRLSKALQDTTKYVGAVSEENLSQFTEFITLGNETGLIPSLLRAYRLGLAAGLSPAQSMEVAAGPAQADGSISVYTYSHFNDALFTLAVVQAEPDTIATVFQILGGDRPYFQMEMYDELKTAVTFLCPSLGITPRSLMEGLISAYENGIDAKEYFAGFFADDKVKLEGPSTLHVTHPVAEREAYFVEHPGELEFAALPYRTQKGFQDGLRDLSHLAAASSYEGDEVGEGFWVFDPQQSTWYSLGGELEVFTNRIRHNMLPYDLSALSTTPYLLHIHPEDLEMIVRFRTDHPTLKSFEKQITEFTVSIPSRADLETLASLMEQSLQDVPTRSFITNWLGTVEFVYPHDIDRIRELAASIGEIRDGVVFNHDWNQFFSRADIVPSLIEEFSQALPDGFKIAFYAEDNGTFFGDEKLLTM